MQKTFILKKGGGREGAKIFYSADWSYLNTVRRTKKSQLIKKVQCVYDGKAESDDSCCVLLPAIVSQSLVVLKKCSNPLDGSDEFNSRILTLLSRVSFWHRRVEVIIGSKRYQF